MTAILQGKDVAAAGRRTVGRRVGLGLAPAAQRPRRHGVAVGGRGVPDARPAGGDPPRGRRLAARSRRAQRAPDLRGRQGDREEHRPARRSRSQGCQAGRPVGHRPARAASTRNGPSAPPRSRSPNRRARRRCPSAATGSAATCCPRPSRAREVSIFVGVFAARSGHLDRYPARRAGRLCRRQGRRLPRVAVQRLHLGARHPADLRLRGGARPRHRHGDPDPRPRRLDRHVPPGARRVHQAPHARVRARRRGDRRERTPSRMFVHILPNVSHVVLVRMSLLVVGFIKAEVILSFLGLGVPVDAVSWGTMLSEAQSELVLGHWWQLAAATDLHGGVRHRVLAARGCRARRARSEAEVIDGDSRLGTRPARVVPARQDTYRGGGARRELRRPGERHRWRWSASPVRARASRRCRSSSCCRRTRSSASRAWSSSAAAICCSESDDVLRKDPRQGHLGGVPGADDLAQPGIHGGRPDRRGRAAAPRLAAQGAPPTACWN